MENNQPIKSFRAGGVRASIFANVQKLEQGRSLTTHRVVLDRRYKDKDGNWKSTNGYSENELQKARLVLQLAYQFLAMKEPETADNGGGRTEEDVFMEG